ncbi:hypothetical protein [Microbacterium sp. JB110]|uniref:hypothetical protein n=1 Tax=Microbacterium sp. JB110 TaxID=2024477 RepID=UPI00097F0A14|nr:hypothetical protein [Microbacterium sp. JB110]RCS60184.1 zinc-binding alcohol dehydrogenase [Microbacterium sp. JB110]SJM48145.1 hypothetical protein CZ774_03500 [Frigoribacterium sp. JB110]
MHTAGSWRVNEGTDSAVLAALYLRSALGIRIPAELPPLRETPTSMEPAGEELEAQWHQFWQMTVEPEAHPADVPLDLVDGFGTLIALPRTAEVLRRAAAPLAADVLAFVERTQQRLEAADQTTDLTWTNAVQAEEQRRGRAASPFRLRVQILPFAQRGAWWIGQLTIAVSDGLRGDVVAFGSTIRPIVADVF